MKTMTTTLLVFCLFVLPVCPKELPTPIPPPTIKPNLIAQCGVGLGLLAGGVVIYIGLKNMCKKLDPPPPGVPPPFIPPIIIFNGLQMPTNVPQMKFDDSGVTEYDVSAYGWHDYQGNLIYGYFKTTLQSTVTGNSWTNEFSVVGYCSSGSVLTIWSDCHGSPCYTNVAPNVWGLSTNNCAMPIDCSCSHKFFRLMSAP